MLRGGVTVLKQTKRVEHIYDFSLLHTYLLTVHAFPGRNETLDPDARFKEKTWAKYYDRKATVRCIH